MDLFSFGDTGGNLLTDKAQGAVDGREEDLVDDETGDVRAPGKKAWMEDLGELLHSENQYEESFDLDGFLKQMG